MTAIVKLKKSLSKTVLTSISNERSGNKTTSNSWMPAATAAFVIGSIAATYFLSNSAQKKRMNKITDKQQKQFDQNLTTPANLTFGIVWPVIYGGTIALAVHQALPSQVHNPRYIKARPWLIACYFMNAVFGYFFSSGAKPKRIGASLTTISLLPLSLLLHQKLEIGKTKVTGPENILHKFISSYAGWLTAASVISCGNLLLDAGYTPDEEDAIKWTHGVITATAAAGIGVSKMLNDPYYLLPLSAAFIGIGAKQYSKNLEVAVTAGISAAFTAARFVQLEIKK